MSFLHLDAICFGEDDLSSDSKTSGSLGYCLEMKSYPVMLGLFRKPL